MKTFKGSTAYRWIDKNNKRLRKASAQAAEKIRATAQKMGLTLTKSGNISKSKKNQHQFNQRRKTGTTSGSFKAIDRVNKSIKTWQSSPEMMEYLTEKMKTFGINPTPSGRLPKGKQAQEDPAIADFIRWFDQNIGTEKEFKQKIAGQHGGDYSGSDSGAVDISIYINAYDQYSKLIDTLFKSFNSSFAYSVYQYFNANESMEDAEIISQIKNIQGVLDSDLPYTASSEDFKTYVQKNSVNPWD